MPEDLDQGASTYTIPEDPTARWTRREKRLNLVVLSMVILAVLVALTGMVGVRTTTASASSVDLHLEVLHAAVTRPGLATPFAITIQSRDGPLPESVTMRIDSEYLEIFDEHGLTPTPSSSYSNTEWTWWTFEPRAGSRELTVSLDARLEPSVQWRRSATVSVMTGTEVLVERHIETWVLP